MNKELIKINNDGLVSARELHEFLGISKRFSAWFETYTKNEDYGFTENEDFTSVLSSTVVNNGAKRELQDYAITIDMAKELSMLSRSEKGKQARKYFIQCEKELKNKSLPDKNNYFNAIDKVKYEIGLIDIVANSLHINDNSKLMLITNSFKNNGINTNLLPQYTNSKGILKSATELLKSNNYDISTIKFNKLMIEKGYLERKSRTSSKDKNKVKYFNSLINLEYGENKVSPKNPNETQPLYYENRFNELLNLILNK